METPHSPLYRLLPLLLLSLLLAVPLVGQVRSEALRAARQLESSGATVALLVRDLQTDSLLLSHRAKQRLCPASLTKLVTTSAFLALRGADYRFTMPLLLQGQQQDSLWVGDLLVGASGDPSLGSHYIPGQRTRLVDELASLLRGRGIRKITGDLRLMLHQAPEPAYGQYWLEEDLNSYYGVPVAGCNVGDNYADLFLTSRGEEAEVDCRVAEVSLPVLSELTGAGRSDYSVHFTDRGDSLRFTGELRRGLSDHYQRMPLGSPSHYAALWLVEGLRQRGITVTGAPRLDYDRRPEGELLGRYQSLPADTLVRITNFRSTNIYAEALAYALNSPEERPEGLPQGVLRYWTERLQLAPEALELRDGSGLSRSGRLEPEALELILRAAWQDSTLQRPLLSSLPRAGYEGSVRSLKLRPELTAQVKSGSLRGVRGYAGYLEHEGRWYSVVYIANGAGAEAARQGFIQSMNELFYAPSPQPRAKGKHTKSTHRAVKTKAKASAARRKR